MDTDMVYYITNNRTSGEIIAVSLAQGGALVSHQWKN